MLDLYLAPQALLTLLSATVGDLPIILRLTKHLCLVTMSAYRQTAFQELVVMPSTSPELWVTATSGLTVSA
jgi:hypothetical protein